MEGNHMVRNHLFVNALWQQPTTSATANVLALSHLRKNKCLYHTEGTVKETNWLVDNYTGREHPFLSLGQIVHQRLHPAASEFADLGTLCSHKVPPLHIISTITTLGNGKYFMHMTRSHSRTQTRFELVKRQCNTTTRTKESCGNNFRKYWHLG